MLNKRRKVGRQPVWPTQKYRGGDPTRAARCCDLSWPSHPTKTKTFIAKASRAFVLFLTLPSKPLILSPPRLFAGSFGTRNGPESAPRTASKNGSQNA